MNTTPPCVIAIGETVMDILFRKDGDNENYQPLASTPGGSTFNTIISIGRSGVPCAFIGYAGNDIIGRQTRQYLSNNNVQTEYFRLYDNHKSSLALAFLDKDGNAQYDFYKDTPHLQDNWPLPHFTAHDILILGSYYAISPGTRPQVRDVVTRADTARSVIYYDINFRRTHQAELDSLLPAIQWNMQHSDIVRGSADDFDIMFGTRYADQIYTDYIRPYCQTFIYTSGAGKILCYANGRCMDFHAQAIPPHQVVSTVGAGDNFNAGIICQLIRNNICKADIPTLGTSDYASLIHTGIHFASTVCRLPGNNVPEGFKY